MAQIANAIQISYIRLLVGDNSRTDPFYTDDQIERAGVLAGERAPYPSDLRITGLCGAVRYPQMHPLDTGSLSLATLTNEQLASLTEEQLASMVN